MTPSEEYHALADAMPQIVWTARADGHVDYYNRRWFEYTGSTLEETSGWGWQPVLHPDDLQRCVDRWTRSLTTGEQYDIEYRFKRASDGAYRWHLGRALPMRDASGSIVKWFGTCVDIHDQKRAEESLRFIAESSDILSRSLDLGATLDALLSVVVPRLATWALIDLAGGEPRTKTHESPRTAGDPDWIELVNTSDPQSVITAPLSVQGRTIGTLTAVTTTRAFENADVMLLEDIAARAAFAIEHAQLYARERRVAVTLQDAFLSKVLPDTPGLTFDATYAPGSRDAEVGGDWYDAFRLPDGRIGVSIGDVCGSGLDAAVSMGKLRQAIQSAAMIRPEPAAMLAAADLTLRLHDRDAMATALAGVLDPFLLTFTYTSAGHPSPLVRTADGTFNEYIGAQPPLGVGNGDPGVEQRIRLERGSFLVLYTDGLIEATRDLAEGERRLREALSDATVRNCDHPARAIHDAVLTEGARDDVAILTLCVAQVTGGAREDEGGPSELDSAE